MARKNPAAVALGRRGGRVNSAAQQQARARNARLGGRPSIYRLGRPIWRWDKDATVDIRLQRWDGDRWLTLDPPYDRAARKYLSRHQPRP